MCLTDGGRRAHQADRLSLAFQSAVHCMLPAFVFARTAAILSHNWVKQLGSAPAAAWWGRWQESEMRGRWGAAGWGAATKRGKGEHRCGHSDARTQRQTSSGSHGTSGGLAKRLEQTRGRPAAVEAWKVHGAAAQRKLAAGSSWAWAQGGVAHSQGGSGCLPSLGVRYGSRMQLPRRRA